MAERESSKSLLKMGKFNKTKSKMEDAGNASDSDEEKEANAKDKIHWIPDEAVKGCYICFEKFTMTFRRHHCRNCGNIVCGNCSLKRSRLPSKLGFKQDDKKRICDLCAYVLSGRYHGLFMTRQRIRFVLELAYHTQIDELKRLSCESLLFFAEHSDMQLTGFPPWSIVKYEQQPFEQAPILPYYVPSRSELELVEQPQGNMNDHFLDLNAVHVIVDRLTGDADDSHMRKLYPKTLVIVAEKLNDFGKFIEQDGVKMLLCIADGKILPGEPDDMLLRVRALKACLAIATRQRRNFVHFLEAEGIDVVYECLEKHKDVREIFVRQNGFKYLSTLFQLILQESEVLPKNLAAMPALIAAPTFSAAIAPTGTAPASASQAPAVSKRSFAERKTVLLSPSSVSKFSAPLNRTVSVKSYRNTVALNNHAKVSAISAMPTFICSDGDVRGRAPGAGGAGTGSAVAGRGTKRSHTEMSVSTASRDGGDATDRSFSVEDLLNKDSGWLWRVASVVVTVASSAASGEKGRLVEQGMLESLGMVAMAGYVLHMSQYIARATKCMRRIGSHKVHMTTFAKDGLEFLVKLLSVAISDFANLPQGEADSSTAEIHIAYVCQTVATVLLELVSVDRPASKRSRSKTKRGDKGRADSRAALVCKYYLQTILDKNSLFTQLQGMVGSDALFQAVNLYASVADTGSLTCNCPSKSVALMVPDVLGLLIELHSAFTKHPEWYKQYFCKPNHHVTLLRLMHLAQHLPGAPRDGGDASPRGSNGKEEDPGDLEKATSARKKQGSCLFLRCVSAVTRTALYCPFPIKKGSHVRIFASLHLVCKRKEFQDGALALLHTLQTNKTNKQLSEETATLDVVHGWAFVEDTVQLAADPAQLRYYAHQTMLNLAENPRIARYYREERGCDLRSLAVELPDRALVRIYNHLSQEDRSAMRVVCRSWHRLLTKHGKKHLMRKVRSYEQGLSSSTDGSSIGKKESRAAIDPNFADVPEATFMAMHFALPQFSILRHMGVNADAKLPDVPVHTAMPSMRDIFDIITEGPPPQSREPEASADAGEEGAVANAALVPTPPGLSLPRDFASPGDGESPTDTKASPRLDAVVPATAAADGGAMGTDESAAQGKSRKQKEASKREKGAKRSKGHGKRDKGQKHKGKRKQAGGVEDGSGDSKRDTTGRDAASASQEGTGDSQDAKSVERTSAKGERGGSSGGNHSPGGGSALPPAPADFRGPSPKRIKPVFYDVPSSPVQSEEEELSEAADGPAQEPAVDAAGDEDKMDELDVKEGGVRSAAVAADPLGDEREKPSSGSSEEIGIAAISSSARSGAPESEVNSKKVTPVEVGAASSTGEQDAGTSGGVNVTAEARPPAEASVDGSMGAEGGPADTAKPEFEPEPNNVQSAEKAKNHEGEGDEPAPYVDAVGNTNGAPEGDAANPGSGATSIGGMAGGEEDTEGKKDEVISKEDAFKKRLSMIAASSQLVNTATNSSDIRRRRPKSAMRVRNVKKSDTPGGSAPSAGVTQNADLRSITPTPPSSSKGAIARDADLLSSEQALHGKISPRPFGRGDKQVQIKRAQAPGRRPATRKNIRSPGPGKESDAAPPPS